MLETCYLKSAKSRLGLDKAYKRHHLNLIKVETLKKLLFSKTAVAISRLRILLLITALAISVMAIVPTVTSWVDGKQRAEWTFEARNYWCNWVPAFIYGYRGFYSPIAYIIWDSIGEYADELANRGRIEGQP